MAVANGATFEFGPIVEGVATVAVVIYALSTFKHEDEGKCCKCIDAKIFIVTNEGKKSCHIYPYAEIDDGLKEAASWWRNWVAFDVFGNPIEQGGYGFAIDKIKENGT